MNNLKFALYGYGGHAREVAAHLKNPITYFVDEKYLQDETLSLNSFDCNIYKIMIAIGDPNLRMSIVNKLPNNTVYYTFIHESTLFLNNYSIEIGVGTFIGAGCILTDNIKIGNHCILNRSINIGHDTMIDNFVSIMPGSIISGNVNIGKNVYIGSGTVVNENVKITSNVVIGSNSTVINDIIESGTYAGNPIRLIKR